MLWPYHPWRSLVGSKRCAYIDRRSMGASQRQSLPMVGAAKCLVGILKHHLAYFVISSKVKQQRIVVLGYDPTMASIEELHDRKIDEILHYGPHLPMKKLGCIVVCFIFCTGQLFVEYCRDPIPTFYWRTPWPISLNRIFCFCLDRFDLKTSLLPKGLTFMQRGK